MENDYLKKTLATIYAGYLPKSSHPFVYISLRVPSNTIDINVHPSKAQVHFLAEEQITKIICDLIAEKILNESKSRTFNHIKPAIQKPLIDIYTNLCNFFNDKKIKSLTM